MRNPATGFSSATEVRSGRFLLQGIAVGGPYVVVVRRIGLVSQQSPPASLHLGEVVQLEFVLQPAAAVLDTVVVVVTPTLARLRADPGIGTTISDTLLHHLPTLDRNLYDFLRLTPQVSSRVGLAGAGFSGGGVGLRFNNFLLDGVPERFISFNASLANSGGKSIPLEAIKEYQVLLAPYDVRYGGFAGALVNQVTRSGTNDLQGTVFLYARNDWLGRQGAFGATAYDRQQFGFSLAGPLLRDRLHFFIAPELQRLSQAAAGPYLGQSATSATPVPVGTASLGRFETIMREYGLSSGSSALVRNRSPLTNAFARVDLALPRWNSHATASLNYGRAAPQLFTRAAPDTFSLSSYQASNSSFSSLAALQVQTALRNSAAAYNSLILSHQSGGGDVLSDYRQPVVLVAVPRSGGGGAVTLRAGTEENAQGRLNRSWTLRLTDDVTLALGAAHVLGVGVEVERFAVNRRGVSNSYGTWTFSSLDSLASGAAERFVVAQDFGGASTPLRGAQYGVYASDQWRVARRLSLTLGVRADLLTLSGHPPYNARVDSVFQRRTDRMPPERIEFSPRAGFTWELTGSGRQQLRGGVGLFSGRPPLLWAHAARYSYGTGIGVLRCGQRSTDAGAAPAFQPDVGAVPTACANGSRITRGDVDLLDPDLRLFARTLRLSLAYEHRLPWDLVATAEALVTRNRSDFAFENLNLAGPEASDRHGRVMYGSIATNGTATPLLKDRDFSEVINVTNASRNSSYQLSARLEKRPSHGIALAASYTYSRVRDVATVVRAGNLGLFQVWSTARALSGSHADRTPGISLNDLPHRVVLALTWFAPWRPWSTELSLLYVGESGSPFTYLAGGLAGRGDLNADGSNANDPIYVPASASDSDEILFSGPADSVALQQAALEELIRRTPCLRRQRGRILERNSCREPFAHTSIASLRQSFPLLGRVVETQLDLFNVLNLLDRGWGLYRVARPVLLEQVAATPGPPAVAQPIFRFNLDTPRSPWTTLAVESAFQLQLGVRLRF